MKTNYVLVDCENVKSPAISLPKGEQFRVWKFLGQKNTKLKKEVVLAMQIEHLRSKHMLAVRSESIEAMPCLQASKKQTPCKAVR
jgi:hypothetical protein